MQYFHLDRVVRRKLSEDSSRRWKEDSVYKDQVRDAVNDAVTHDEVGDEIVSGRASIVLVDCDGKELDKWEIWWGDGVA